MEQFTDYMVAPYWGKSFNTQVGPIAIGMKFYPIDNSYTCNLDTGEMAEDTYLAGNSFGGKPKLVELISLPYEFTLLNCVELTKTYSFINVKYNGVKYRILTHNIG